MSAQSGNSADSQQTSQPDGAADTTTTPSRYIRYIGGHRNIMAIAAVTAIAVAIVGPYIATAGIKNFGNVVTGQPVSQETPAVKDTSNMDQQEQPAIKQTTGNSSNSSQTNITVNGQSVPVPQNGSYSKTVTDTNGRTDVRVEASHSSSSSNGSSSNNSSVQLNIQSESHSSSGD